MKRLVLLALCLVSCFEANALDSDWKLCKGDVVLYGGSTKLVVNVYEHRNGNGRLADLTFIYGGHVLHGNLNTTESISGTIKLKGINSTFKGTANIDYQTGAIHLIGKLALNNFVTELNGNLDCETL